MLYGCAEDFLLLRFEDETEEGEVVVEREEKDFWTEENVNTNAKDEEEGKEVFYEAPSSKQVEGEPRVVGELVGYSERS